MDTNRDYESGAVADRSGGVNISGSAQVRVGGDVVGRDKIESGLTQPGLEALVSRLTAAIRADARLDPPERDQLLGSVRELHAEIGQPSPDLTRIQSLKQTLSARGAAIAAATGAIFQYGPVQDALKAAMQRLLGG